MWDLPGPGLEPVSPALKGRFLTTAPPGKSRRKTFEIFDCGIHLMLFSSLLFWTGEPEWKETAWPCMGPPQAKYSQEAGAFQVLWGLKPIPCGGPSLRNKYKIINSKLSQKALEEAPEREAFWSWSFSNFTINMPYHQWGLPSEQLKGRKAQVTGWEKLDRPCPLR